MVDPPAFMQAIVLTGPGEWEIQEVPTPQPEGTNVICRVRSVAISGTDPNIIKGLFPGTWPPRYPFVIGHEWSGEVVAVAPEVHGSSTIAKRFAPGARVAGEAHCGCGICANCLAGDYTICLNYGNNALGHHHYGFTTPGAFATYVKTSVKSIHPLPEDLSYDEGAMLDTAGVALSGVYRAGVKVGDTCCVTGPGPTGTMTLQLCRAAGAKKVIMVGRGARLQSAVELGAIPVDYEETDDVVEAVWDLTEGRGADVVFECAGTKESCTRSPLMVRKGGKLVMIALANESVPLEWSRLTLAQVSLIGVNANANTADAALTMLADGRINGRFLNTHTFPLDQFGEALATLVERRGGAMKVMLRP